MERSYTWGKCAEKLVIVKRSNIWPGIVAYAYNPRPCEAEADACTQKEGRKWVGQRQEQKDQIFA